MCISSERFGRKPRSSLQNPLPLGSLRCVFGRKSQAEREFESMIPFGQPSKRFTSRVAIQLWFWQRFKKFQFFWLLEVKTTFSKLILGITQFEANFMSRGLSIRILCSLLKDWPPSRDCGFYWKIFRNFKTGNWKSGPLANLQPGWRYFSTWLIIARSHFDVIAAKISGTEGEKREKASLRKLPQNTRGSFWAAKM